MNKFTTISCGSEQEHEGKHVVKRPKKSEESKTFDNDIAEATLDFDFKEINNLGNHYLHTQYSLTKN